MDDENGLELNLGLSLGGPSVKSKVKNVIPDINLGESSNKGGVGASEACIVQRFHRNGENQEDIQKQIEDIGMQPYFWKEHVSSSAGVLDSSSALQKRGLLTEDPSIRKKYQRISDQDVATGGATENSPISISTDDGSTGENDDVVESEAEGSNSWIVSHREDRIKGSDIDNVTNKHGSGEPVGFQRQKQPSTSGSEGKVNYGISLASQAVDSAAVPYDSSAKTSCPSTMPVKPPASSSGVFQFRPPTGNVLPIVPASDGGNVQMAFGYPTIQLPTLETTSSWMFGTQAQNGSSFALGKHSDCTGDVADEAVKKFPELVKSKSVGEAASSSSAPEMDEKQEEIAILQQRETLNQSAAESSLMGSAIKPGLASNVKFGGCGSYPDLPWVSTTGPGVNGRTISGVTYKYGNNQLRIVCACHGSHMSPEEFVQHAIADPRNIESNASLAVAEGGY